MGRTPGAPALGAGVFLALAAASCGNCGDQAPGGVRAQEIVEVCAPTEVRSGEGFVIRVRGGCAQASEGTTCRVTKQLPRVAVSLQAESSEACAGFTEKPCSVPALEEGTWQLEFDRGRSFDRQLSAAPGLPGFVCPWLDGGAGPDGG